MPSQNTAIRVPSAEVQKRIWRLGLMPEYRAKRPPRKASGGRPEFICLLPVTGNCG